MAFFEKIRNGLRKTRNKIGDMINSIFSSFREVDEEMLDELENLANTIKDTALCGLGQTAPNPILSTLRYFKDEYIAHVRDKKCPAGTCRKLFKLVITDACKGCTKCARNCPVNAITGTIKQKHVIDQAKCIKCGACIDNCPFHAIVKE